MVSPRKKALPVQKNYNQSQVVPGAGLSYVDEIKEEFKEIPSSHSSAHKSVGSSERSALMKSKTINFNFGTSFQH